MRKNPKKDPCVAWSLPGHTKAEMADFRRSSSGSVLAALLLCTLAASFVSAAGPNEGATTGTEPRDLFYAPVCNTTGACLPCTSQQKADDAACQSTGYRQALSCVRRTAGASRSDAGAAAAAEAAAEAELEGDPTRGRRRAAEASGPGGGSRQLAAPGSSSRLGGAGRGAHTGGATLSGWGPRSFRFLLEGDSAEGADGVSRFTGYQSCRPAGSEGLSVLGFEGIMLAILAVFAPVVYHRKRRNAQNLGMSRNQSSSRL